MAATISSSRTISGDTFYRNNPFDIQFSVSAIADTSFYFGNSTGTSTSGVLQYASGSNFRSTSGIPSLGAFGTLSVDAVTTNPVAVQSLTPLSAYVGTTGCCTDPSGNLYFVVANQNKIFRRDPSGAITTFAGTGTAGNADGPRLSAQFNGGYSITTDGSGTFYVTDFYKLRKIDPSGTVSTVAGQAVQGYADGFGSNALFRVPNACVIRPNGDILVTDSDAHVLRNVTPDGVVTTYAGASDTPGFANGTLTTASGPVVNSRLRAVGTGTTVYDLSDVSGSWTSTQPGTFGNVFAVVAKNDVRGTRTRLVYGGTSNAGYSSPVVYQPDLSSTLVGATGFGTALTEVRSIAYDPSSNLMVAGGVASMDVFGSHPPFYSLDNGSTWTAPTRTSTNVLAECRTIAYGNGKWLAAGLGPPDGPSVDPSANLLISTDGSAWTSTTALFPLTVVNKLAYGNGTWVAVGGYNSLCNINYAYSTDDGATWTKNLLNTGPISVLNTVAYNNGTWVVGADLFGPLWTSTDVSSWTAVTPTLGTGACCNVMFSSTLNKFVAFGTGTSNTLVSSDGSSWSYGPTLPIGAEAAVDISETYLGPTAVGTARFFYPSGLAYSNNTLYVADTYNNRIRVITTDVSTYAGTGADGATEGPRLTSQLGRPSSLSVGSNGVLYVASADRHTIRVLSNGTLSNFAGRFGTAGYVDGAASNSRFNAPSGLAIRSGSNLFVTELLNGMVREVTEYPEVRPGVPRVPTGGRIIATSNYPIVVNSRIDVCWTSIGGVLPLFKYEPFSNQFTANRCGADLRNDTLIYSASSTELLGYLTGTGTRLARLRASNGATTAYTYPLSLVVSAVSNATIVDTVSTSVTIGTARILYSPCNASLVFYRNEPISPVVFSLVSSSANVIYSGTSLPTGLALTRSGDRSFTLSGTPTTQTITSNYLILAQDTSGRTYSTQVSIGVNPERLVLDVSGSLSQSNVISTSPIQPITFTSRFPPYTSYRSMRYTWSPPPPIGLEFRDLSGRIISGSSYSVESPYDASFALTLSGTISDAQLLSFASNNVSTYTITINASRTSPLPSLSPAIPRTITLAFGETIFFTSKVPPLFVGLDVSSEFFYFAKTYFAQTDTSIQTIDVVDGYLPDGLTGGFVFSRQRFELSGTPLAPATYPFTLRALNGRGVTTDLRVSPTVARDFITITSPTDTCFNFIQYRSLSNSKSGFYPRPIQYSVRAGSTCNVTLTGANLPAGVELVSSNGSYVLSGTPTAASGSTTAVLTARVPATGVDASTSFTYSVSAETFFFSSNTFGLVQNVAMTPVQIDVSTLSETPVLRFSAPGIPPSLQITNTGNVRGVPEGSTSGTFDVTAFSAFSSGCNTYAYTVSADRVLLQPSVFTTTTAPGCNVSIPITGYSLSAMAVSNYRFQTPFPYGLAVNPTTGLLSGTLAASLPATTPFTVLGSAGIVDGALTGTMTTVNLTTSRAQLIEIQAQSNLRVYFSDDRGFNWSLAYSSNALVAGRVGVNNTDTYLIPTSSDLVLRSTTGSNYTTTPLGQSSFSPLMTGVASDPSTSTWWIGGTLSNGSRSVRVFKTLDNGATWDGGTTLTGVQDRSSNASPGAGVYNAYLYGGVDLAYRNGVLLLGGKQIVRSTDGGATWSIQSSSLLEVARFSLDQGDVWLAVGSSLYSSATTNTYTADATTIVYSLDQGVTWTNAIGGFNMNAYEVVYGGGVWLASGLDWTGTALVGRIRYSFDGLNWTVLTSIPSYTYATTDSIRPPGVLGTIGYDQTDWKILRTPDDGTATLYSHPGDVPIDSEWTSTTSTGEFSGIGSASRFSSYVVQTINPGPDRTTITFPPPNTGPTFVSPAQTTYVVWQYMPIPAISFSATGTAPISYFVSTLPVGLTWDSSKMSVSGACMRTGVQTFTVYAVDGLGGVTAYTITLICEIPRIIKQQTGAGAYTALVRDYTEVAAAIHARDTRVNAPEPLGSFAAPYPPDVVTPSNCPC